MQDLTGKQVGRYLIQQAIGEGGMGVVYRALDTHLDSDVAIKVLMPGRETDGIFLKRFQREAQSMARLTHPNLVKVMDYGERDGMVYLVMPYVVGGTLAKLSLPMSAGRAAALLMPVARALGYAHRQGMIHRDVKPSNVLLTESGEPMVTDFGIAGLLDATETEQITKTGSGVGTPAYMAPEQIKKDYDHRVDIYALGVVLYELVTGQQPFKGDTPLDTLVKHATEPLPPPREINPDVPPAVEAVIVKALAKRPDQRYQTMEDFAQALQGMVSGSTGGLLSAEVEQVEVKDTNATVDDLATPASLSKLQAGKKKEKPVSLQRKIWLIGAGLVVVTGLVWGLFSVLRGSPVQNPETEVAVATTQDLPIEELASVSTFVSEIDGMEMVFVPAGEFTMGSTDFNRDEQPEHEVYLDGYWIDKFEVTNTQYAKCVASGACLEPKNTDFIDDSDYANYPVDFVDWNDAESYCAWSGRRLPTEAEWEKAARGTEGQTYPWGETLSCEYTYYSSCHGQMIAEVGSYPDGISYYGAMDMAGNVWEWTNSLYEAYPYDVEDGREEKELSGRRVIRGGSWTDSWDMRSAARSRSDQDLIDYRGGFRCAVGEAEAVDQEPFSTEEDIVENSTGSSKVSEKDGMEQVYVPAGEFTMGSDEGSSDEQPVHEVVLDGYWMDKYEVTNALYAQCVADGGCDQPSNTNYYLDSNYVNHPVVYVSWNDAQDYCTWAGRRLPSEAEWEKAARDTDGRTYPWGDESPAQELLNFNGYVGGTTKVGTYPDSASPYGALDMAGNVMEWTADWYDNDYYAWMPGENPPGPVVGERRVVRGSSWNSIIWVVRSADRNTGYPEGASDTRGFRCAESAE